VIRVLFGALVAAVALLPACSSNDGDKPDSPAAPAATCPPPEKVPTFADLQRGILPICLECHSVTVMGDARHGAPPGMNFDTYSELSIVADTAVYLVQNRMMPYPDGAGPTEEQRQELYDWAACGKPR
jgi:uncharacterized membrane protein